jgi:integrase
VAFYTKRGTMSEKRIVVWVQHMADRPYLMLQWHEPLTGKRKSKSAGTCNPLEAEKLRADLEYELNHHLYQDASRISWEAFRQLFEREHVAGTRKNTRLNYRVTLELFEQLCQPKGLRAITERTISTFVAGMRQQKGYGGENMQPSTIKMRLAFLRAALNWAADQKLIPECPRFPSIKVPKKKPQPVAVEAFERLIAKADGDPHMQAFLLCGWLAGLRLNEALALEWDETTTAPWLDLSRNRIILPAELVKAVEDQWLPLDPALREALESLPRQGRKVFCFVGKNGRQVGDVAVSRRVVMLARLAGIRLSMRSLRRGFGCRYAGKVPAQVLQKLMRHANITITMDYYANVDAAMEEAVLGPQRNTSRNSEPKSTAEPAKADGASALPESGPR